MQLLQLPDREGSESEPNHESGKRREHGAQRQVVKNGKRPDVPGQPVKQRQKHFFIPKLQRLKGPRGQPSPHGQSA